MTYQKRKVQGKREGRGERGRNNYTYNVSYCPKNKPPSLFDPQVDVQVFFASFTTPHPYSSYGACRNKLNLKGSSVSVSRNFKGE